MHSLAITAANKNYYVREQANSDILALYPLSYLGFWPRVGFEPTTSRLQIEVAEFFTAHTAIKSFPLKSVRGTSGSGFRSCKHHKLAK